MAVSKSKIAYFCSRYPAVSHTFINREIQQLEKTGFEIHPFTMNPGQVLAGCTPFEKQQLEATYCLHTRPLTVKLAAQFTQMLKFPISYFKGLWFAVRLQKGRLKESLWALFHFLEAAMLAAEMKKRGLSHVHVHFANSEASIAMYAAKAFNLSFSFTLHGPDCFYNTDLGLLAEKIKRASFLICISNFARGQAIRLGGPGVLNKSHIVHCGVDPQRYAPPVNKAAGKRFKIVCTGRLTSTKGQILLVMACERLIQTGLDFQCVFIGGGDQETLLRQIVAEKNLGGQVLLTGALPQDKVLEHLQDADLFVLPSFAEGVPVVLMEAMSMGVPCVATRVGGIAELIDHQENGWLIHSGDPDTLTSIIQHAATNREELIRIGQRARKKILAEFDVRESAKQLATAFKQRVDAILHP